MPRQRQRIVFCDCFDCRDRPEVSLSKEQLDAATAVARQEPPPKALLLYASGFVIAADGVTNLDSCALPHCNLVVREGNLGLLAVRPPVDAAGPEPGSAVSELAQLLGVYQELIGGGMPLEEGAASLPSLAARFKGMQAAFASTSATARQLAQRLGMALLDQLSSAGPAPAPPAAATVATAGSDAANATTASAPTDVTGGRTGALGLPDAGRFAAALSAELGAAEGANGRDLLLLHVDLDDLMASKGTLLEQEQTAAAAAAAAADSDARWDARCDALEWLDSLVKGLLALPEIRERTLLVLMLSPAGQQLVMPGPVFGGGGGGDNGGGGGGALLQPGGAQLDPSAVVVTPRSFAQLGPGSSAAAAAAAAASTAAGCLSVLDAADFPLVSRPVQSYEMLGMARVDTDVHTPVLVARRLPGVVRRDRAERLSYKEALTAGGMGVVRMDRLMPDIAYKIGRAPKYGA